MKAYTLIELIVVIALMAIVLLGGTTILFRNLRSSGTGNVQLAISSDIRSALAMIERDIRFSTVTAINDGTREDCLNSAEVGLSGNTLTVLDLQGLETVYASDSGRVASVSSATTKSVFLTSPSSTLMDLRFTWYCRAGVSDKIRIDINMYSAVLGSGFNINRTEFKEVNLLNSGLN